MFKRAVITDEISQEFETAAKLAAKYGLDGLEIRSVWEKSPHELEDADIERMKEICSRYHLEVCALSAPLFKCDIDDTAEVENQKQLLRRSIEVAKAFGAHIIRGFTFWSKGDFEEHVPEIARRIREVIPMLEADNMQLVIEFDPSVFACNARRVVRVLQEVNSPCVRGLWDPGNDLYAPDPEEPFPQGYELMKPYIAHMHLKDSKRDPKTGEAHGVAIGQGDIDYAAQFTALLQDGYDGYVSLETHYRPSKKIDEDLLALPKGSAFSYLGEEATEECLINWNELLRSLGVL